MALLRENPLRSVMGCIQALRGSNTISPREREPDITIDDAYHISLHVLPNAARLMALKTIVGKKISVTSKPVQDMLGADFGFLIARACAEWLGCEYESRGA
jgi:2-keto-4-pentenoate hydratase